MTALNATDQIYQNFNDYNYPSLKRSDLMHLSVINSNDFPLRKFKQLDTKREWSTNLYNLDIERSAPRRIGAFTQKTDFINKLDDIEKTSSMPLHVQKFNKVEYNLSCKDISGASPNCTKIKSTRYTNPLDPVYQLPKVDVIPLPVPRFLRDSIDVKDIEGASPKKSIKFIARDNFFIHETPPVKKGKIYNSMDYSDVTHDVFKTSRCVNPLDPVYEIKYNKGSAPCIIGDIPGSKPATFNKFNYPDPMNLKLEDIEGTKPGTKNRMNRFIGKNYSFITSDIQGAQVGSLHKGMVSVRNTNPLAPAYRLPGEGELKGKLDNPYGCTIDQKKAKARMKIPETIPEYEDNNKIYLTPMECKHIQLSPRKESGWGFNNQFYYEDHVDFDAEKYKRPKPFFGFVRDRYILPSQMKPQKNIIEQLQRSIGNGGVGKNLYMHSSVGNTNATNDVLVPKPSNAQQLDIFMKNHNLKYPGQEYL